MSSSITAFQRNCFGLALIILIHSLTSIGFVLAKKILNAEGNIFSFFIPLLHLSTWLIPVSMGLSGMVVIHCFFISANNNRVIRKYPITILVWTALFFITFFPIGNWIKYQTFFYEYWMWLCALWFHTVMIALFALWFWLSENRNRDGFFSLLWVNIFFCITEKKYGLSGSIFLFLSVAWTIFFSFFLGDAVLGGIPHVQDSIAQLFQAKAFALGLFSFSAPIHAESFERIYTVMKDGRWYSIYPPGHAMLLSLGVLLHVPQWVNPISGGISVWLSFLIAKKLFGLPVARLTVFLLMISPFFMLMSAGWMNHPTALLMALLLMYGLMESANQNGWKLILYYAAMGLFFGMLFLTRPVTAMAFLIFGLMWLQFTQKNNAKLLMIRFIGFAIGVIPPVIFYFIYNTNTTGSQFLTGYVQYFGGNPLGFGKQPWGAEPLGPKIPNEVLHTPWLGLANTIRNLNGLNYYLFGFPVPSLLFAALVFLPGMKRCKEDWLCLVPLGMISLFHFFYFFQDFCYGPRFVYETVPFLCMLSARGILMLMDWLSEYTSAVKENIISGVIGFVMVCVLCSFCVVWVECCITMSQDYWSTRDGTLTLAKQTITDEHALFFTELDEDFAAFFSVMDPRLDRGWIVAHDLGEAINRKVMQSYPNVPVYSVRLQEIELGDYYTVIEPYTYSVIGP